MVKYPNAASGIKKVFLAKIIGVIGVPLAFIPGIGALLLMTCTVAATIFNVWGIRSEEHTSELQSHSLISYAVFCLKKNH